MSAATLTPDAAPVAGAPREGLRLPRLMLGYFALATIFIAVLALSMSLHASLRVVDLHADTLLWTRDLLERSSRGHVDLPRLREGGVAVQGFSVVTKTPLRLSIERNADGFDPITLLAVAERWPARTWTSLLQRALYQSERLHDAAARSSGALVVLRTADDLARLTPGQVGGVLTLEGAQALEGGLANVDALHAAGFRAIGLAHFLDTDLAGSAHGAEKGGLTALGRDAVRRMEELGIAVDLAHISPRAAGDVLAIARRPVLVSHTGVRATCDNQRNLSDELLRAIGQRSGLVGIGFWPTAVCGSDAAAIARAVKHALAVAGPTAVALGSDFDGTVVTPFDAAGLAEVTTALLDAGLTDDEVRAVMGANALAFLRRSLVPGASS